MSTGNLIYSQVPCLEPCHNLSRHLINILVYKKHESNVVFLSEVLLLPVFDDVDLGIDISMVRLVFKVDVWCLVGLRVAIVVRRSLPSTSLLSVEGRTDDVGQCDTWVVTWVVKVDAWYVALVAAAVNKRITTSHGDNVLLVFHPSAILLFYLSIYLSI